MKLVLILSLLTWAYAFAQEVTVAAASDLRFTLEEIIDQFERMHPEVDVSATYGSTGNLFAEIANGAPFDLFFSASTRYIDELERLGRLEPGTRALFARGSLVIWAHERLGLDTAELGVALLSRAEVTRIVVANPQHAPYGEAAVEFLRSQGLLDSLESRLVFGENVSQAAQIALQSGQVGLIARSLALNPRLTSSGSFTSVPPDRYPPLDQEFAIVAGADSPEVRLFRQFILAEDAQATLARHGFTLPSQATP